MNYRVLLVDDNRIALESMRKTVPWAELGLEVVGTATSGTQGCQMITTLHPDILVSDIHMPELDGLEMLEKMSKELAGARVIFITAYEKIEYASKAIRLSAFDFLLKPLDNQELIKSLQRAIRSLDEERSEENHVEKAQVILRRARFLSALAAGSMENPRELFPSFLAEVPESYFFVVAESENGIKEPLKRIEFASFPENVEIVNAVFNRQLVLFCGLRDAGETWQTTARAIADVLQQNFITVTIAVGSLYHDPASFYAAYQDSRFTLLRHDIYGRRTHVEFAENQQVDTGKHARMVDLDRSCDKLVQQIDTIEPQALWDQVIKLSGGRFRLIRIVLMLLCTKVMQSRIASREWTESSDMIVYDITKLENEHDARNWLFRFLNEIRREEQLPTKRSALVRNVLEYIRSRVTEGLLLEDVAREFYVSPNYLSSIIHKETGITYRQHVINAKMTVAKQMLDDTRMRVEDIAYAVGYENYISFYNVFKKAEHMSPTEYRLQNWTEEEETAE